MLRLASLITAPLLLLAPRATANHFTCNWGGPNPDPGKAGFTKLCEATQHQVNDHQATFHCDNNPTSPVADWGFLAPGLLEFGTPCNGGGYGSSLQCETGGAAWGICIEGKSGRECKYLNLYDDCAWPGTFTLETLPSKVIIYNS